MGITPLALSALALLAERPMHPYEMYQLLLERHEDELVKVRPGSLYHAVERLEDHELVEVVGTEREGNRPERTTYAITTAGRSALVERIRDMLSTPVNEFPQFPVALGEAHNGPADLVADDLRSYVAALDEQIHHASTYLDAAHQRGVPEVYLLAGEYVRHLRRAERDWITTLITRIETKDLPWHPDHP
ncbi:PadR family transcriptional regulator [Aeromicrobium sp. CFBP 8757]|nr:PadR family transcriptional regulator [Aeromicrobium sp. CFBP 8757]